MTNREKLKQLAIDVFLLDEASFRFDLRREEVDSWDSFGMVALANAVHETFDYHFTSDEALRVQSLQDVIDILSSKGISFD